jgi:flagellar basal body-associated protein FliL
MALDEKKTEETAAAPSSESGNTAAVKKWLIVSGIMLMFIGCLLGMSFFIIEKFKPQTQQPTVTEEQLEEERRKKAQAEVGAMLAAPIEVTVNVSGEDGKYLKCGIQLEYDAKDTRLGLELENRRVPIKNAIIDIMSSSLLADLETNDGKRAVRERIVAEVNLILPETLNGKPLGKINRSYFDSFMIQ